jgi:hypothetical protein
MATIINAISFFREGIEPDICGRAASRRPGRAEELTGEKKAGLR